MKIGKNEVKWLGHAGFLIKNSKIIYIDPYKISSGMEKADIILITHSHYDHCSLEDMNKIVKDGTIVVAPADCQSKITRFNFKINMRVVEPGQEIEIGGIKIIVFPAYNKDKSFHPKEEGWVGYVIKENGIMIYHAGDTDILPEMQKLTGYKQKGNEFIALLPIGGRFTMSVEEAVEAAKIIKPSLTIPMHWGSIVGEKDDAKEFLELCSEEGIKAKILEKD
jgi:L-ascorbate metabolism protein UlaG (beta-lactamase superfamily)